MPGSAGGPQYGGFSNTFLQGRTESAFNYQGPRVKSKSQKNLDIANGDLCVDNDIADPTSIRGSARLVPSSESDTSLGDWTSLPRGSQPPNLPLSRGTTAFNSTRNSPDRSTFGSPEWNQTLPVGYRPSPNGWNGRQDTVHHAPRPDIRANSLRDHFADTSQLNGRARSTNSNAFAGNHLSEDYFAGERYTDLLSSKYVGTQGGISSFESHLLPSVSRPRSNHTSHYSPWQAQAGSDPLDWLPQSGSRPSYNHGPGRQDTFSESNGSNGLTSGFRHLTIEDENRNRFSVPEDPFPSQHSHLGRTSQNQHYHLPEAKPSFGRHCNGVENHSRQVLPLSGRPSGYSTSRHAAAYNFDPARVSAQNGPAPAPKNSFPQYPGIRSLSSQPYAPNAHPFLDQQASSARQEQRHQHCLPSFKHPQPFNSDLRCLAGGLPQQAFPGELQMGLAPQFSFHASRALPHPHSNSTFDTTMATKSELLQHFKTHGKNQRWDLRDIYDHICEFAGDQTGSRFIQSKLEKATGEEKDRVFRELQQNAVSLMRCSFGNYVIQKLFEYGDQSQKTYFVNCMKDKVLELSYETYACRVVQKALDFALVEQQASMVRELQKPSDVMSLVKDENGNHVMQKVITAVPLEYTRPVIETFLGQIRYLATHKYGCRIVQRLLERTQRPHKQKILAEVHECAQILIEDIYGNYTPQLIIKRGDDKDRDRLIELVTNHLLTFSKSKYASNVVEKCLQYGSDQQKQIIMYRVCEKNVRQELAVSELIWDQYGNYVIQTLLENLRRPEDYRYFIDVLRPEVARTKQAVLHDNLPVAAHPLPHDKNEMQRILKQADNITKKMEQRDEHCINGAIDTNVQFNEWSTVATPGLTTGSSQSPLESALPSTSDMTTDMTFNNAPRKDSGITIDVPKESQGMFRSS